MFSLIIMKLFTKNSTHFSPGKKCYYKVLLALVFTTVNISCKKILEVNTAKDKLLAEQVYTNDVTANSAIAGIYRNQKSLNTIFTLYNSLVSDEIVNFTSNVLYDDFKNNQIQVTALTTGWSTYYLNIYGANSAIEGIASSVGMSDKAKAYYTGEAKFIRAFNYFYLVNLFGDVPLITTTEVSKNSNISRSPVSEIYSQIISDLKDAQQNLGSDYSFTGGEHTRANKWVATAFLAKVYLYLKDYSNSYNQANDLIISGAYTLLNAPDGIFAKNNSEAIYQWANSTGESNSVASSFIFTTTPILICTDFLLNSFEASDKRKTTWIKAGVYSGKTYYYPYKFTNTLTTTTEYYTVLRLAEIYLIRAEAEAQLNKVPDAVSDINIIRAKHGGLSGLSTSISQSNCLTAIMHERQVELFTEGVNRWLDLKRSGTIDAVLKAEKPLTWTISAALFPLPISDIQRNPNLKQNPGY
jgi:hypothetical protein